MSVVLDAPRTTDFDTPSDLDEGVDLVIAEARAAGRLAGERLARTPLTPRQRAVVASVMGGDR